MLTVNEVSKRAGVSIRTLQYYDNIGLLKPAAYTESGYRMYDDASLEKLQQILLFRELEFPLCEIKEIVAAPDFDREKALDQQIKLLTMRKNHLEDLIKYACEMKKGAKKMDFTVFDTEKIKEYSKRAKEEWGQTEAYKEYEEKSANWTDEDEMNMGSDFMQIFVEFGRKKDQDPESEEAQSLAKQLQEYISGHFYNCTKEILGSLGEMYAAGGEFTENIDAAGGKGTAEFASKAIKAYCTKK